LGVQEKKEEILIQALGKKRQDPDRVLPFSSLHINPLAYLLPDNTHSRFIPVDPIRKDL